MNRETIVEKIEKALERVWDSLSKAQSDFERGQKDGIAWAVQIIEEIKEAPLQEPQCGD